MSFIENMRFNLQFRLGVGILIAAFLSATARAQNIGIGTASPASKLSVNGNMSLGDTTYTGTAAPTGGALIQGNVGIGTTAPIAPLHVTTSLSVTQTGGSRTFLISLTPQLSPIKL
jgi:hypothetical protein